MPKRKMFNDLNRSFSPSCTHYVINDKLIKRTNYSGTTFGFGNKMDLSKPLNNNPGSGSYHLNSSFD